jgi:hypothetical protein
MELLQYKTVNKMSKVTRVFLVLGFDFPNKLLKLKQGKDETCLWLLVRLWLRNTHMLQSYRILIIAEKKSQTLSSKFHHRRGLKFWKQRLVAFIRAHKSTGHRTATRKRWRKNMLPHRWSCKDQHFLESSCIVHATYIYSWLLSFKTISELVVTGMIQTTL